MTDLDPRPYLDLIRPGLVPIAGAQHGICQTCRSGAKPGYANCYPCSAGSVISVLPISMSEHGGSLHHRLRLYKRGNDQQQTEYSLQIAALLGLFLRHHMNCIGGPPDAVVTVCPAQRDAPSTITRRLRSLRDCHVPLAWAGSQGHPRFHAPSDLKGQRVLLIDDTFTTGRNMTAACEALAVVDAEVMIPLVIGRHFRTNFATSRPLHECLQQHIWRLDRCGICSPITCPDIGTSPQLL